MKTVGLVAAAAFALLAIAPVAGNNGLRAPQAAVVAAAVTAPVLSTAPAQVDVTVVSSVVEMSANAMSEVRGDGWWSKITNVFKRLAKWVYRNRQWIWEVIQEFIKRTQTQAIAGPTSITEVYSAEADEVETYDEAGNLTSSSYSETAEVFEYTEETGG